ncbi:hypothetical protein [Paenibacillus humicola]|uniref:hypothetical protein n=1 Tax=Paenibacillus humicola TaxID=3110540 RepID=UPI00237C202D|nr:hypothetical protein [Paenibacillus humicola]
MNKKTAQALYNVGWLAGLLVLIRYADIWIDDINRYTSATYQTTYTFLLPILFWLIGVYVSLIVVNITKFRFHTVYLLSTFVPILILTVVSEKDPWLFSWLTPHPMNLELLSIGLGIATMISCFPFRQK